MQNNNTSPFDLERFKAAQDICYHRVKAELTAGKKYSHWMWYIFPQIKGLGHSQMDDLYSIKSREEACSYLCDPLLQGRLYECVNLLLAIDSDNPTQILGRPDDIKLRSSMTLFAAVAKDPEPFNRVLLKFFFGEADPMTLSLLDYPL